jgi:hypothetical protein
MHLAKTAPTTPALAHDKRHNNEWKWHMSTLMLAHDRRVLDVPLEERLLTRTSALLAWAKTMLPAINRSVRDARTQIKTGHPDICSCFSQATVVTMDDIAATPTVTSPARPNAPHEPGWPRFPPTFVSISPASPTAPRKSIEYQPTIMYTN